MKFAFFSELDIPRMVLNDFAAQHIAVNMRIYLRSCNGFMPQHALDCPQVGSTFQQVRGKEWRKVWGLMFLVMPAASASSLIMWKTMMREMLFPQRARKT